MAYDAVHVSAAESEHSVGRCHMRSTRWWFIFAAVVACDQGIHEFLSDVAITRRGICWWDQSSVQYINGVCPPELRPPLDTTKKGSYLLARSCRWVHFS